MLMEKSSDQRARSDVPVLERRDRVADTHAGGAVPAGAPTETDINAAIAAVIRCWLAEDGG